ncbi:unnamed protein product, partial [Iphiclides podalirius]
MGWYSMHAWCVRAARPARLRPPSHAIATPVTEPLNNITGVKLGGAGSGIVTRAPLNPRVTPTSLSTTKSHQPKCIK